MEEDKMEGREESVHSEESAKPVEKGAHKKRTGLIIVLAVLLLAALALGYFFLPGLLREKEEEEDFYDPMAVSGILPGMSESEIQAALDRVVEEGMLNISISGNIDFAEGTAQGRSDINNIEANHYDITVVITLEDSGETVYESKGIQPGQYIQYIQLQRDLEAGQYPALVTVTAYTRDTRQIVGRAAVKVMINVNS